MTKFIKSTLVISILPVLIFLVYAFFSKSEEPIGLRSAMGVSAHADEIPALSFDSPASTKIWKGSKNAHISIDKGNWPSMNRPYAEISFKAGNKQNQPPIVYLNSSQDDTENPITLTTNLSGRIQAPIELLKKNNQALSAYDFLEFKTYNPSSFPIDYTLNIKDPDGRRRSVSFYISLKAREEKLITIDLKASPLYPSIDLNNRYLSTNSKNANTLEFTIPLLPKDVNFYISEVQLIKGRNQKAMQSAKFNAERIDGFDIYPKSSMEQIFIEKVKFKNDGSAQDSYKLYAAKNESESFQAVIYPGNTPLNNVTWSLSPLKNANGDSVPATVSMVGYVQVKQQPRYRIPFLGWYPDPILPLQSVKSIPENEVLPLWIKTDVSSTAPAGTYKGELTINSDQGTKKLNIELEVWDFQLPKTSDFRMLSQFIRLNSMSQFMPPKTPASSFNERSNQLTERFENWMLSYKLQPGNIYSSRPPQWDTKRLRELVDLGLNAINLSYIKIDRNNANNYNEAEYWKIVETQIENIKKYIPTLKESGVWDNNDVLKYIFLFDEWPGKNIDIVYKTAARLKKEFPTVKLMTTATDVTYGINKKDGDLIDIWIPHVDVLQSNKMYMDYARTENRQFGWYFAVGAYAPYPNFWLENEVIQSRISMGALSYIYNTPIFVYWAVNRWFNNNPRSLVKGPKTLWKPDSYGNKAKNIANGEGSIFYARVSNDNLGVEPVSTLRMENVRDGIEDYEYYVLLNEAYQSKQLSKATVSSSVIKNVAEYTDDPTVLLNERIRIAKEILRLKN